MTAESKSVAAVFLDRDGVINYEKEYVGRIEDFDFIPGVPQALKKIQSLGFVLFIITNQAGIARGYYSEKDFDILTHHMLDRLMDFGVEVKKVYYCPHHPVHGKEEYKIDCTCRKPSPGMILKAIDEFQVDISRSVLIGDKLSDLEAGKQAGVGTKILVRSGHPISAEAENAADITLTDLSEAARRLGETVLLESKS